MAKEWVKISLSRYMITEDGIEIVPEIGADVAIKNGNELEKVLPALLKQLMAVELPPADVLGGKLRPMTDKEVEDYRERRDD